MWSATLDSKTAEYDASLDGQVWDIDEDHPMPVDSTHPNCRCVLVNIPFADWKPSKRLDNKTRQLIDYQDYATWSKDKGIDDDTADD